MKICLCGSTRFKKEYLFWNALLTASGHIVYSVSMWSHGDRIDPSAELKKRLDAVHMGKIANSDCVFVIDQELEKVSETYTGESTRREVEYATILDKDVYIASVHGTEFIEDCEYADEIMTVTGIK